MASVIRRGSRWSVAVYLGQVDGKKKYSYKFGFLTSTDARRYAREIENQRDAGIRVSPARMSLADFLNDWLRDFAKPNLKPTTYEGYESILKSGVIPAIGKVRLDQLTRNTIQNYAAAKLATGCSPRTVKHHLTCLSGAFEYAITSGLLMFNLAHRVTIPPPARPEMHTLSAEDVNVFLEAARAGDYYALFYLLIYTGLRRSEALALRWKDVDLVMCQLAVTRSLHKLHSGEIVYTEPKTKKSRRNIDLTPSTAIVLREHLAKQKAIFAIMEIDWRIDCLIFSAPDGNPMFPNTVSQAWERINNRLGFSVRLHDARHSHASLLLQQGVNIKIIQERPGHSSITTTMDVYGHLMPGMQAEAIRGFDDKIKNTSKGLTKD